MENLCFGGELAGKAPDVAETWRRHLERLDVTVAAPGHRVFLTVRGTSQVRVALARGHYERVTAAELSRDLTCACRLLVARRAKLLADRAMHEAGCAVTPRPARSGVGADHLEAAASDTAECRRRLDEIVAVGEAAGGQVRTSCLGLADFAVFVAPGIAARLTEDRFTAACRESALAVLADRAAQIADIRFDVYVRPGLEAARAL